MVQGRDYLWKFEEHCGCREDVIGLADESR